MLALIACACTKQEDVKISGVEGVKMRGVTMSQAGIDLALRASNASGSKVMLTAADFSILKNGEKLLNVVLTDKAVLHRKSDEVVTLPLNVRFGGMLGALGMMSAFSKGMDGVTVSGTATVRTGWLKKKVRFENVPADVLLRSCGLSVQDVMGYIK